MRGVARVITAAVLACALFATCAFAAASPYRVTVRRTAHGIPHIIAKDFPSLTYGYAYAFAQDNLCVLADVYVTVNGERSRYFGPKGTWKLGGNGTVNTNLASDFFFQKIKDQKTIEKLVDEPPPAGPDPRVKQGVEGFAAGYNDYLADVGVDHIPDPACRGKDWVRPITAGDVYRRFYELALLASSGVAIDGIGAAQPPPPAASDQTEQAALARQAQVLSQFNPQRFDELMGGIGSNAVALGKQATTDGHGVLLGNPHFPWDGTERFWQSQLTIPGQVDVAGGSLFGVPLVLIGFTKGLAWSHTVSTARRFTPFELTLVPGSPTTYLVDGQPKEMTKTKVTIQVKQTDGTLVKQSRTLYDTQYGPILTAILGLPVFPWTPSKAFALGDANAPNFRYLNHFFFTDQAQSVKEYDDIERKYLGIPWVNSIATDAGGTAYYADIGSVPNVSNAQIQNCSTALGQATDQALRVQVLDGSRGGCNWANDPDAIKPGIFGASHLPSLMREDYVTNSNDSYWLSNPAHPLEGFSRVIGDERTARSPRTRLGLRIVQQRLDGTDGHPGKGFDVDSLAWAVFNDRQYLGELWRDELVAMCEANPTLTGSNGPVDVSGACPVLKAWDLHDNLDSKGTILFQRFASHALAAPGGAPVNPGASSPYRVPFDPADPVNTPRGLNTDNPQVKQALADAVTDLHTAGAALDAPLGQWQYEMRGKERIPIHGGPGTLGVFNALNTVWNAKTGYSDVPHGSSHVQVVHVDGGCPKAKTILTYSQSSSPESPWFADQTRMFSSKQWVDWAFCPPQIAADPQLQVMRLNGGYAGADPTGLVASLKVRGARRRAVLTVRLRRTATVVARSGTRSVKRRLRRGRRALTLARLPRGRQPLVVTATAGTRSDTYTRGLSVRVR